MEVGRSPIDLQFSGIKISQVRAQAWFTALAKNEAKCNSKREVCANSIWCFAERVRATRSRRSHQRRRQWSAGPGGDPTARLVAVLLPYTGRGSTGIAVSTTDGIKDGNR